MAANGRNLCRAVEKQKILYDHTFRDTAKKEDIDKAWEAIAAECNESVIGLKNRWRSIRKNLLRSMDNQGRKTRSREYYLYDDLKFLLPHLDNVLDDLYDNEVDTTNASGGVNNTNSKSPRVRTPGSTKEGKDEDCNENNSGSEYFSSKANSGSTPVGEKRKRESRTGQATLTNNITNNNKAGANETSSSADESKTANKNVESYIIAEPHVGGASSIRFRRVGLDASYIAQKQLEQLEQIKSNQEENNLDKRKKDPVVRKLIRTRSQSMYLERPVKNSVRDDNSDDDEDYKPPTKKKATSSAIKNESKLVNGTTPALRKRVSGPTKGKANETSKAATATTTELPTVGKSAAGTTTEINTPEQTAKTTSVAENKVAPIKAPTPLSAPTPTPGSEITSSSLMDIDPLLINPEALTPIVTIDDDEDYVCQDDESNGIDMTLLAAAAAAEAEADEEKNNKIFQFTATPRNPMADVAVQCDYLTDEEDDEFLGRISKWLQQMNPRQKMLFRKGIYQAFIDVYDDPRNFVPMKSNDKFPPINSSTGMPAYFHGMSPMEMRLVRNLAMTITCLRPTKPSATTATNTTITTPNPPAVTTASPSSSSSVTSSETPPPPTITDRAIKVPKLPIRSNNANIGESNHKTSSYNAIKSKPLIVSSPNQIINANKMKIISSSNNNNNNNNSSSNSINVIRTSTGSSASTVSSNKSHLSTTPVSSTSTRHMVPANSVRTTAIALPNARLSGQNLSSRLVRKVVRVSGGGSGGITAMRSSPTANSPQSTRNASPSTAMQQQQQQQAAALRARAVSINITNESDKQKLYHVLPTGTSVQCITPITNGNNDISNPYNNNRKVTSMPSTVSAISSTVTSTSTTVITPTSITTTNNNANINNNNNNNKNMTSISLNPPTIVRRPVVASNNSGRNQMARRYSVCGSGIVAASDLLVPTSQTRKNYSRRSLAPPVSNSSSTTTTTTTTGQQQPSLVRVSNLAPPQQQQQQQQQQFLVPSPPSAHPQTLIGRNFPSSNNNLSILPNNGTGSVNSPTVTTKGEVMSLPSVQMSSTKTHQSLAGIQQQQQQKQQQQQPLQTNFLQVMNTNANKQANMPNAKTSVIKSTDCIITPDTFDTFVIKNEPLDLDEEE